MSKARQLADNGAATPNRNLIINGAMTVAQRNTSVSGLGADNNDYETVDRWRFLTGNTAGRYTLSQATDTPSDFSFSTKIDVTTADTSIAAGEYFFFRQLLEGKNVQQLNKGTSDAKKITVSFYVKGNANATYLVELEDADNSRLNSQTFNVTSSWTKIVKTFTADTTGALDNDTANSFNLVFWLHAGSTYTSGTHSSNTWASNVSANRVPSSNTSIFDSTDREFYITGIQMEIGEYATPFEHKSFIQDLEECYRYYHNSYVPGTYPGAANALNADCTLQTAWNDGNAPFPHFPKEMRGAPSVVVRARGANTTGQVNQNGSAVTGTPTNIQAKFVHYIATSTGSSNAGTYTTYSYECDAEI